MNRCIWLGLALLLVFIFPAPTNAESCGVFHKKVNDLCVHFDVPSNAHLTYSGNSWDCNRGFKRSGDGFGCEEIRIPVNASENFIGSFSCNSGYKKDGDICVKAEEEANGKFYEIGADFYCLSGYKRNELERKCEKIVIPANAREDSSSLDGWRCFSGYLKEGNECKKFNLPEHGYWFIDFWGCEPGFKKNTDAKSCEKIFIPENAHASNTFDGWLCNSGYTKNYRENRCDKLSP
ncbi:MAG TPA: hypothetical protein VJG66_04290 [Patescibacteria group bacterium]|nr:hypothetical protein [Patescibacteria group bacterium]